MRWQALLLSTNSTDKAGFRSHPNRRLGSEGISVKPSGTVEHGRKLLGQCLGIKAMEEVASDKLSSLVCAQRQAAPGQRLLTLATAIARWRVCADTTLSDSRMLEGACPPSLTSQTIFSVASCSATLLAGSWWATLHGEDLHANWPL